jgi:hypothetical protein
MPSVALSTVAVVTCLDAGVPRDGARYVNCSQDMHVLGM